jgi:hypothetical protein
MNIEKLSETDLSSGVLSKAYPSVRFNSDGRIFINRSGVQHLKLYNETLRSFERVSICHDKDNPCEFFIIKDASGKELHKSAQGEATLHDAVMARHVINKTFERCAHAADTVKPDRYTFRIALFPVDDDKNKDVYALLRKNG